MILLQYFKYLFALRGFIFQYSFVYTMDSFNKPKAEQLQVSGKARQNTSQYHGMT